MHVEEQLKCFSCGCGCYTRELAYFANGTIYFHVTGFPIPEKRRGLFEVVTNADGTFAWRQRIRGRIEPPLVFSPSGCKVAYYEVSYLGNELVIQDLCGDGG